MNINKKGDTRPNKSVRELVNNNLTNSLHKNDTPFIRVPYYVQLEPRMMFDGAAAVDVMEMVGESDSFTPGPSQSLDTDNQSVDSSQYVSGYDDNAEQSIADALLAEDTLAETFNSSHNQNIVEVSMATEQLIDIDPYVPVNSNDSDNGSLDNANNITSSLITFDILSYEHDVMTTQSDTTLYIEGMGEDSETVSSSSNFVSNELETRTTIDYASAENNNWAKDKQVSELGRELTLIQQNSNQSTTQLVAIDGAVKDSQVLLEAIYHEVTGQLSDNNTDIQAELALRGIEIKYIESEADGMSQLSGFLSQYNNNLDALHILSHGSDGSVQLGNGTLGANNIDSYQLLLEQWQDAFSAQGDIMIYGCDVARSEHGEKFLQKLALLTQTDLAASNNVSGSGLDDNGAGSDWDLEFSIGSVDSSTVLTVSSAANYQYVLADPQWSISGDTSADEGGDAEFTISLTEVISLGQTATIDLSLNNNLTDTGDYADFSTAVNSAIGARTDLSFDGTTLKHTGNGVNMSDLSITMNIVDDAIAEGVEGFEFSIGNPGSTTGLGVGVGVSTGITTTINDTQGVGGSLDNASWSLFGGGYIFESDSVYTEVSLSGTLKSGATTSIDFGLTDITTNSADYADFVTTVNAAIGARTDLSFDGTTLTYTSDGSAMSNLSFFLDSNSDNLLEGDEDYSINIANAVSSITGQVDIAGPASVITTIIDAEYDGEDYYFNDATWSLVGDNAVDEGGIANYTLSLTGGVLQAGETATVEIAISDVLTDSSDYADFIAAVNSAISARSDLSFDGVTLTYTGDGVAMTDLVIGLTATDDAIVEGNEDYNIAISNAGSTTLSDTSGSGDPDNFIYIHLTNNTVNTVIADTQGVGGSLDNASWSLFGGGYIFESDSVYTEVSLSGTLKSGATTSIDFGLTDITTNSADYADFVTTVNAAIGARTDLSFDGTTLTYTSDGSAMSNLSFFLDSNSDNLLEGDEDYSINIANAVSSITGQVDIAGPASVITTIIDAEYDGEDYYFNDATWSLVGDNAVDEGGIANYTLSLTGGVLQASETATVEIAISDVLTDSSDYADFIAAVNSAISARSDLSFDGVTLTYTGDGVAMTDLVIGLTATDDAIVEGNEDYNIAISNAGSTTLSDTSGSGDPDNFIYIHLTNNTVNTVIADTQGVGGSLDNASWSLFGGGYIFESDSVYTEVSLSGTLKSGATTSIDFGLTDITTNSADYADFVTTVNAAIGARTDLSFDGTTLTYTSDGSAMSNLSFFLDSNSDNLLEGDEDYSINIANAVSSITGQVDIAGPASVITTIIDAEYDGEDYYFNDATWSLVGDNAVDEGGIANYTLSLTGGVLQASETATVEIAISDVLTDSSDYADFIAAVNSAISARSDLSFDGVTLTYTGDGVAMTDLVIGLTATDDAIVEGNEDYNIAISNAGSTTLSDTSGSGDPDNFIYIHLTNNTVNTVIADTQGVGGSLDNASWSLFGGGYIFESDSVYTEVSLSGTLKSGATTSIDFGLTDITTNSADYADFVTTVNAAIGARTDLSFDGTTLTYTSDGSAMSNLSFFLDSNSDNLLEGDEDYSINIANAVSSITGQVDIAGPASVITTIIDAEYDGEDYYFNDATWSLVGDNAVDEGGVANYTLSLTGGVLQASETATVEIAISDVLTDSSDYADFIAAVNSAISARSDLSFDGVTLTYTGDGVAMTDLVIGLTATDDAIVEGNEDYNIAISNAGSTTLSDTSGSGDPDNFIYIHLTNNTVNTVIADTQGVGGSLDNASWSLFGGGYIFESDSVYTEVSLSGTLKSGATTSIDFGLTDITTNSADYADFVTTVNAAIGARTDLSFDGTTLTYTSDGSAMSNLSFFLDSNSDNLLEGDEDYSINIANAVSSITGQVDIAGPASVITTIIDAEYDGEDYYFNDATWSLVGDNAVDEGGIANYTLSLTGGVLQAGETATVEIAISDVLTDSSDYADFIAAVNSAISARSDLSFDGVTLTYTGDGVAMTDLVIGLTATDDAIVEGNEDYNIAISNAGSTTLSDTSGSGDPDNFIYIHLTNNTVNTVIADTQGVGGSLDNASWSLFGGGYIFESDSVYTEVSLSGTLKSGATTSIDFGLTDITTNSADYADFVTTVNAAIGARTDLSFDGTTLTYTSDGSAMSNLSFFLDSNSDNLLEGDEDYSINIANAVSSITGQVDIAGPASVITTIIDAEYDGEDYYFNDATWSLVGDNAVDEGGIANYTLSLTGGVLQASETATVEIAISDVLTDSSDYADFIAAVNSAISARSDLSFDGVTLTYTGDGVAMTDLVIGLTATDDAIVEGNEDYNIAISNAGSTTLSDTSGSGDPDNFIYIHLTNNTVNAVIADTQGVGGSLDNASWSLFGGGYIFESDSVYTEVSLSGTLKSGATTSIDFGLTDITTNSADYADFVTTVNAAIGARTDLSFDGTTLTYTSDGSAMSNLSFFLDSNSDNLLEGDEDYSINIANAVSSITGQVDIAGPASVITTIIDAEYDGEDYYFNDATWSLVGDNAVDEGGIANYTLSLTGGVLQAGETATVEIAISDVLTDSSDYADFIAAVNSAISARSDLSFDGVTLTYTGDGVAMTDLVIGLTATDDAIVEGNEDYNIAISNAGSTTLSDTSGSGDPDNFIYIHLTNNTVNTVIADTQGVGGSLDNASWSLFGGGYIFESDSVYTEVSLSGTLKSGATTSIDFGLTDITTNSADYADFVTTVNAAIGARTDLSFDGTTLTYTSDGSAMSNLSFFLDSNSDNLLEGDEDYSINIANAVSSITGQVDIAGPASVITTIIDAEYDGEDYYFNDATWSLVGDNAVDEGGIANYTLSLTGGVLQASETATVEIAISDVLTDSSDYADFIAAVNSAISARSDLSFDGVTLTYTGDGVAMTDLVIGLTATDDAIVEGNEDYNIAISNAGSTTLSDTSGSGDPDNFIYIHLTNNTVNTVIADTQGVGGSLDNASWSLFGGGYIFESDSVYTEVSLSGTLKSGATTSIDFGLTDITTNSADYADFVTTVNAAIGARTDLSFDGTTLTYTSDGSAMSNLSFFLDSNSDNLLEGDEDYSINIANAVSSITGQVDIAGPASVITTIIDAEYDGEDYYFNDATWSLVGDNAVDEGGVANYTLSLTGGVLQASETATVEIAISDVLTDSSDYADFIAAVNSAISARSDLSFDGVTLTYTGDGVAMTDLVIGLTATDDAIVEGNEDYNIAISNAGSTTLSDTSGSGDPDNFIYIHLTNNTVNTVIADTQGVGGSLDNASWSLFGGGYIFESDSVYTEVSLSGTLKSGATTSIDFGLTDITTNSADYADFVTTVNAAIGARTDLSFDGTTLTYTSDGSAMSNLSFFLDSNSDNLLEGDEDYSINIANAVSSITGQVDIAGPASVITTIIDAEYDGEDYYFNDATWSLVGDNAVDEGGIANYTLSLTGGVLQAGETATVEIAISDVLTDSSDYADFIAAVNSAISARSDLSFDGVTLTYTGDGVAMTDLVIGLTATDDAIVEGNEDYNIAISNAGSTTLSDTSGSGDPDNFIYIHLTNNTVNTVIADTQGVGGSLDNASWSLFGGGYIFESDSVYTEVSLSGTLKSGATTSIDFGLTDITTNSADYADFVTTVNAAIGARTDLSFDGTTLTYTSDGSAMSNLSFFLDSNSDNLLEGDEDYSINIANAVSSITGQVDIAGPASVITTIIDAEYDGEDYYFNDATWSLVGDNAVDEGGIANYTLSLTGGVLQAGETATVEIAISDVLTDSSDYADFIAAVNSAISARSDLSFDGVTLTYTGDGVAMTDLVIGLTATDDAIVEGNEDYNIAISNAGSTTLSDTSGSGDPDNFIYIHLTNNTVNTVIADTQGVGGSLDNASWSISGDTSVDEGGTARYTVSLAETLQSAETATIELTISDITTANTDYADFVTAVNSGISARSDLSFDGTTLTFVSDGNTMTDLVIDLGIVDDNIVEGGEDYSVVLSNADSTTGVSVDITIPSVTTSIIDTQGVGGNLDTASWSISGDTSIDEGGTARYTVSLAETLQSAETATVELGISDITTANTDYADFVTAVNSGISARSDLSFDGTTLTYTSDGSPMTDLTIDLGIVDDSLIEGSEDYLVVLSNAGSTTGVSVDITIPSVTTSIIDTQGVGGNLDTASWSISGDTSIDEGGTARYTVSLAETLQSAETATIELTISDITTANTDYADFVTAVNSGISARSDLSFNGTTLTYTGNGVAMTDLIIDLRIFDDNFVEGSEDYSVILTSTGSTTGVSVDITIPSVTTAINDTQGVSGSPDTASWSISGDTSVDEGAIAGYTLSLTGTLQSAGIATIELSISDITTTASDYADFVTAVNTAISTRTDLFFDGATLTYIGDGVSMTDLNILLSSVNDSITEGDELYDITISNLTLSSGEITISGAAVVSTTIKDIVSVNSIDSSSNIFQVEEQEESNGKEYYTGHHDNPSIHFLWDNEYEDDPERQDVISVNRIITFMDFDHDHVQGDDVGLYVGANYPLPTTANYILDTVNDSMYRIDTLYGNGLRGEIIRHASMGIVRNIAIDEYGMIPMSTAVKAMEIRDSNSPTSSGNRGEISIPDELLFNISLPKDKSSKIDVDMRDEKQKLFSSNFSDQIEEINSFQKAIKALRILIG